VSSHTHQFQVLYRGLGDELSIPKWLAQAVLPMSSVLGADEAYAGARLCCLEMIKGGTTTFTDSHYIHVDKAAIDAVCRATDESGLRGVIARATQDQGEVPESLKETVAVALAETERLMSEWGDRSARVFVVPEPLFTPLTSPELITGLKDLADRHKTNFHMHAGETREEAEFIRRETGKSIFEYLSSLGALGPRSLFYHAVWATPSDIALLGESGASIAHNPVSNMYLADGVAPIVAMRAAGVNVGLGVDGAASNCGQDMFESMKMAALLQKVVTLDAAAVTGEDAIEMATINSARALGLDEEIGSLEVGKKADLIMLRADRHAHLTPNIKPVSTSVYNAGAQDVDTVVVDGRVLMENRELAGLDEAEIMARAREVAQRMVRDAELMHRLEGDRFAYVGEHFH
jgi:5-methylthioadenosine/S-adenosylhomocysteine deaminase